MKILSNRFLLKHVVVVFTVLAIVSCNKKTNNNGVVQYQTDRNKIAQKYEPSDEFFLQRMGADGEFSFEAYTSALKAVSERAVLRSNEGFSESWTTQGPGNIGARINTIAVHPQNDNIIYIGFAGGGVFRTENGGDNWESIFNGQAFNAIGDIALDPVNPDIVYVGTGDPNISGYPKIGDGLYRSLDGGETWTNLGLTNQRIISEIIIDPTNTDNIFVACMGLPFERNEDRGLYRSQDNGATWEKVLFIDDETGVIDIAIHPNDPQIMYAAAWTRIRNNSESIVNGINAQVYKSINGGTTWDLIEGGLPNDVPHNRIGIAIAPSDPNTVYIEYVGEDSELESIYKTTDGGDSWDPILTNSFTGLSEEPLGGFGWYFAKIRVNPVDPDDIYLLGVDLWRTPNGGNLWERASPEWWTYEVHADKHDLVFLDNGNFLLATDGGLYKYDVSNESWSDIENIPATQFYRVAYNPHEPNMYYGGAQDNGTSGGNAENISDWEKIFGGDGFQSTFDPENPERFFVETQRGRIYGTVSNGFNFELVMDGVNENDRRNWDMPYIMSSHNSNNLYLGTQRVYKGEGYIPTWTPISDDLTDGEDSSNRYNNITAIDESVIEEGLLYAGTGDGNIWRGSNDGTSWTKLSENDNLLDQYVTDVVASPHDVNTVYVSYSGYRDNDFMPRIFRSTDQGETWESIASDLPNLAINELLVLPESQDSIIFVATDGGVYGTINSGMSWERLGDNMPIILVYDLTFNEANNQLVAGTFARSIMTYPLDSIQPAQVTSTKDEKLPVYNPLKISPTLATNSILVEFENIELGRDVEIVIISVDGKLVYQTKISGQHILHQVDVSNLAAGQYFVKAKVRHDVKTMAFIKQ